MKKAIALKTFTDSETGRRLRRGDEIKGDDGRIAELKASGLVEKVKDVSAEENEEEERDLARAALAGATLEEGEGPRVSIGFANPRHANAFRAEFAAAQKRAGETAGDEDDRSSRKPRQTKPGKNDRQTKPAPPPANPGDDTTDGAGGPGAGGENEGGDASTDETATDQGGPGSAESSTTSTAAASTDAAPAAPRRQRGNRASA